MPHANHSDQLHKVSLTRFQNNAGEFLDIAMTSPVTLTKHGRAQWKIVEVDQYDRLEQLAAGNLLSALNRQQLFSVDLSDDMETRITEQMPTAEEIAQDRWNDE
jgi:prevent-host-death family protein